MENRIRGPLLLVLIFCATVGGRSTARAENATYLAILPLTGNLADQGEWSRRGFEIAQEHSTKKNGPAVTGKLEIRDSRGGDPSIAVDAYRSLVAKEKPLAVLTYGSGVGMALSPLVNADRVVQMGIATGTPKYRSEGDYTFRDFPSSSIESEFLAEELTARRHVKRLALISIHNDYGVGSAGALRAAFIDHKGEIAFDEQFEPGTTDFKPLLHKLQSSHADAVYLATYTAEGAHVVKQSHELGIRIPFYATVSIIGGKEFFDVVGDSAEDLQVVSTITDAHHPFFTEYSSRYPGESPAQMIYAARAYDAVMLLNTALSVCRSPSPDCVRDYLLAVRNYTGASGIISFDSAGDVQCSFHLFRVHQRQFEPVAD